MRLTLRTLLAWLDDTLPPTEVREIGKQVSESPYARELVDRIRRVGRQRRLTVPGNSGPEAIDPNLVASYLDNDLDPELIPELEKRCLTSDVNLAEVASVHQILSLLGQKAKVPSEVRSRMYQLVKGRESLPLNRHDPTHLQTAEPISKPIQAWVGADDSEITRFERLWPPAVCLLLIGVLGWSAWVSLSTGPREAALPPGTSEATQASVPRAPSTPSPTSSPDDSTAQEKLPSNPFTSQVSNSNSRAQETEEPLQKAATVDKKSDEPSKKVESAAEQAADSKGFGVAEKTEGVLLRWNPERREWERLADSLALSPADRLVCLQPFRANLAFSGLNLSLLGAAEIRIATKSKDAAPRMDLRQGRARLTREAPDAAIEIDQVGQVIKIDLSKSNVVGLERSPRREFGQPVTQAAPLTISCSDGEVTVSSGTTTKTVRAPSSIVVDEKGAWSDQAENAVPSWLADSEPSPIDLQLREQFLKSFHSGRPVLAEIVAATEDDQRDIRRFAISALRTLGDLSYLMPFLDRPNDPPARRDAIEAIRTFMALGPEPAKQVRDLLVQEFGERTGGLAEKLLIGHSAEEASKAGTFQDLVGLLSSENESVGIRELALDDLKTLTGRDDLGYHPDEPEGKGYENWAQLLKRGELRLSPRLKPAGASRPGPASRIPKAR